MSVYQAESDSFVAVSPPSHKRRAEREQKERSDRKVTEKKLTVGTAIKIVVFTVLALIGFLVLWGVTFFLSLAFTLNIGLSLLLGLFISAVTIVTLVTILIPPRRRIRLVLSKRQTVGVYVAWVIIFVLSLPLIKINPLVFLSYLPTLVVGAVILINDAFRRRRKNEMKNG